MEAKAAVLGGEDFVMAFSALGLDTFAVETESEAVADKASQILKEKYGLVVVAENIAPMAQEVFEKTDKQAVPCVVIVPFLSESTGYATEGLRKMLRLATGIDIMAN